MERRTIVLLTAIAVVVVAAFAVISLPGNDDGWDFPEDVTEDDKRYPEASAARADFESQQKRTADMLSDSGASPTDMIGSINDLAEDLLQIRDWDSWVSLSYYSDPSAMAETYQDWVELDRDATDSYFSTVKAGLNGPCGDKVEEALKSADADPETFRDYDEATEAEKQLNSRIGELVTRYDALMNGEHADETATWTSAAQIYIQLVQANNDLAQLGGYDDYPDYAYESVYGRDYTPEDAEKLTALLPEAGKVMFTVQVLQATPTYSSSALEWMSELDTDGVLEVVAGYTDGIADRYADLMDYMQRCHLIYLNEAENGVKGQAYTSPLALKESAYIFANGYSGSNSVMTMTHEFGHASAMCLNRDLTSCMDVKEIHSNGLEALFATSGTSSLRGAGAAMSAELLYSSMSAIVTGILFTEIELYAYETEAETGMLTVDMLQKEFERLLDAAMLRFGSDCDGLYWVNVPHLFESPMYYVSYVTSEIGAVDLFVLAASDHAEAERRYIALVGQRDIDGYVEAVKAAGLTDAFDTDAARSVIVGSLEALRSMA